jgi:hypothetical protein
MPRLRLPSFPAIGDAVPRIRNALTGVASTPRERVTLVIILGITLVIAVGVFAYLILRRR